MVYRPTVTGLLGRRVMYRATGMGRRRVRRRKEDAIKSYNLQHTLGKNILGVEGAV